MYFKYLEVKKSKTGYGVFTKIKIPANSPIIEFTGSIVPKDKSNFDLSTVLQIGQNKILGPSGSTDDYINHSCDPNCYVYIIGNRAILYSLYLIPAGAELYFDYSTSSTDTLDEWKMNCMCGSFKCRKIISGFQYLDSKLKLEYENKDMVPLYIRMPNSILKD